MKLLEPPTENSFYESFSDLIFGTLVLFLVMVMALALQLRRAQQQAQSAESAARLVYEERISGSSSKTRLFITHLERGGKLNIAFVPESLSTLWSVQWEPGKVDKDPMAYPLQVLCSYYLDNREEIFMPYEEFLAMAPGMTEALAGSLVDNPQIGGVLVLIDHVAQREPHRDWTPQSLATALGGPRLHPNVILREAPGELRELIRNYYGWLEGLAAANGADRVVNMTANTLKAHKPVAGDLPPRLRFHVTDSQVQVGAATLSYTRMRALLRALRSGRGFYVEHMGAGGEVEIPPPPRFFSEVMAPTGYVNRTLSEKGLAELRSRGG
jgi:hypothetical protein